MAKHRMPKKHRARKALLAGTAAAGLSGALVLGHATNATLANPLVHLTNTVIGAGGQGDPAGARVPAKLSNTVVSNGYGYDPVNYPATVSLASSRDIGVPVMRGLVTAHAGEDFVVIAGYSEGTLVAEKVRGALQGLDPVLAPSPDKVNFLFIASPFAPNGGIYGRFPGLSIPGVIDSFAPATPSRYDTTYIAMEYDPYADFPAYFNPLALLNSALSVRYGHPDQFYDAIQPGVTPAYVTKVPVGIDGGGSDTYVLVYNQHLPLLGPLREISKLTFVSPFTEPVLGAIEPLLRVLIDMSYTDRTNANVATQTPFSFITPPAKIIEALGAVPGALGQGVTGLLSGGQAATVPPPAPNLTTVPVQDVPAPVPVPAPLARQSRLTLAPSLESEPTSSSTPPTSPAAATSTAATSTAETSTAERPEPPADGLHPTVTSDGNKFTPGETAAASGPTSGPENPTVTTTTATTTTATTTTTVTTPTTPTAGSTTAPSSPEADGKAAA